MVTFNHNHDTNNYHLILKVVYILFQLETCGDIKSGLGGCMCSFCCFLTSYWQNYWVSSSLSNTVNSQIFARILITRNTLKDTFATLKICDLCMIYLHRLTTVVLPFCEDFSFSNFFSSKFSVH